MQGSPMRRLNLRRFQRNLCVVLGNVGTVADLPTLELVLSGGMKWLPNTQAGNRENQRSVLDY